MIKKRILESIYQHESQKISYKIKLPFSNGGEVKVKGKTKLVKTSGGD